VRIVTWNINSVRARIEQLCNLLKSWNGLDANRSVDVILLQEIKCMTEAFPTEILEDLGYNCLIFGQKSYNGVAILSKYRIEDAKLGSDVFIDDPNARYVEAFINGYRMISVYVPNGQSPESSQYQYKLNFLNTLQGVLKQYVRSEDNLIIGGDFNITRDEIDVYDTKIWNGERICCTKPERRKLFEILGIGLRDGHREVSGDVPAYTWWDYRSFSFPKNNGLRLDYILTTSNVKIKNCHVDLNTRNLLKPSDHAPVFVDIEHQ
jgi:exodeoxyribonuclease-3